MGTDETVERAARVSYGFGTRQKSETRALIRYLRRHLHTTPSEMVELLFHCSMPMFVARQWVRHRTACLGPDTEVYFDLPSGIRRRGNQLYKLTLEEVWRRFQATHNRTRPDKQRDPYFKRSRVRGMSIRNMDEKNFRVSHSRVVDVYRNGRKPLFRMALADGKHIDATADHRFLFAEGWRTLGDVTGLSSRNGKAYWRRGEHYVYVNGDESSIPAVYRDKSWLHHQYHVLERKIDDIAAAAGVSSHTIRKWLRKYDLQKPFRFVPGHQPWNKYLRYRTGPRDLGDSWRASVVRARSGPASNFWKGGMSSQRESVGRWTTQAALRIHRQNAWTCQLCGNRAGELHCHHIVPVWADLSRARDERNLTTLCGNCHRSIAGREIDFIERLGGPPVNADWHKPPRAAWNKIIRPKLVRIEDFEFLGEMETFDLEVLGPHHNFIANGVVTHNSVNEYSGRYSLMPLLFYKPERENLGLQSRSNRQGRGTEAASESLYQQAITRWDRNRAAAAETYSWLIGEDVARELARIDLPLSTYTQWYWKIDLHNLLHFLTLRVEDHAQWEIREFAKMIAGILKRVAPLSYEAWIDYDLGGSHFSRAELEVLRDFLEVTNEGVISRGGSLTSEALEGFGLSKREVRELLGKLRPREHRDFDVDLSRMQSAEEMEARMRAAVPLADR
jgi:thymidylate synthase (FAD)